MKSLKGQFLVASPHLHDVNFYRSVVLMVQHDEDGAFGLVLNRPSGNTVSDVWKLVAEEPCDSDQPIQVGGPVPGPLVALHTDAEYSEAEIVPGVFFASTKESLIPIVTRSAGPFRLFMGYAGWGERQLDGELEVGGWLTMPATREAIFSDQDDLWNRVAREIGLDILAPTIKKSGMPDDPSLN